MLHPGIGQLTHQLGHLLVNYCLCVQLQQMGLIPFAKVPVPLGQNKCQIGRSDVLIGLQELILSGQMDIISMMTKELS